MNLRFLLSSAPNNHASLSTHTGPVPGPNSREERSELLKASFTLRWPDSLRVSPDLSLVDDSTELSVNPGNKPRNQNLPGNRVTAGGMGNMVGNCKALSVREVVVRLPQAIGQQNSKSHRISSSQYCQEMASSNCPLKGIELVCLYTLQTSLKFPTTFLPQNPTIRLWWRETTLSSASPIQITF
jgi:hypothetical protein